MFSRILNLRNLNLFHELCRLLWSVVNSPRLHHSSCQALQSKILRNLEVSVQMLKHGNERIGRKNMFTYIFEKVSPIHLANHIPEHFCLRSFMYRSLQQKVQCAIDSSMMCFLFALLVSMDQLRRQAAKTAGNGVELN